MDKAKPYGVGPDINGIFAFLRARFGISATDARARLQWLRRDLHTMLQEHAATVMRLAQICLKQTVKGIPTMPLRSPLTTWDSITSFWRGESPQSRVPSRKEKPTFWRITCTETAGPRARWTWSPPLLLPTQARNPPPVPANVAQMTAALKVAQLTDILAKLVSALAPKPR